MMLIAEGEVTILQEGDIVAARRTVRETAAKLGFSNIDVTRIVTAASELARNTFKYGKGGVMRWGTLRNGESNGIELRFEDQGPGIADVSQALQEGFTTAGGLGMGLPGARRLMDEMEIHTESGQGTIVIVKKWLHR